MAFFMILVLLFALDSHIREAAFFGHHSRRRQKNLQN
jgi:hypothetical protein